MQQQNAPKNIAIFMIMATIIVSGIILGFLYSLLPEHHPQKNQQACENAGGDWSIEEKICLLSYKETGEIRTDGGQCVSGICSPPILTAAQKINLATGPLENISGTCYPDDAATGCVAQVQKGTVSKESLCLDYQ